jgi:hypothetical protein
MLTEIDHMIVSMHGRHRKSPPSHRKTTAKHVSFLLRSASKDPTDSVHRVPRIFDEHRSDRRMEREGGRACRIDCMFSAGKEWAAC